MIQKNNFTCQVTGMLILNRRFTCNHEFGQKRRNNKSLVRAATLVLLLLFLFTGGGGTGLAEPSGGQYRVKAGDFVKTMILSGNLMAQQSEHFVVPVTDTWRLQIKWMVKEGEEVKPGDTVVRFDTSNLGTDIENLENSLQVKKEQMAQKKTDYSHQQFELAVELKKAEIDYQKALIDASIPAGIEAKYEYDKKQLELKRKAQVLKDARGEQKTKLMELKTEIKLLDIGIREERAKLERYKETLKSMSLTATTAGTFIYETKWWENSKVQIGDTLFSSMPVAYIPVNDSLQVEALVNESDIHQIKPGEKARLILDAYPQRSFTGTLEEVFNSAEDKKNWGKSNYFRAKIRLDSRDVDIMKPGMSVKCIVRTAAYPDVLLVPLEMAYFDGRDFWIKVKGAKVIKVNPLDYNEFHLALPRNAYKLITNGAILQPLTPAEVEKVSGNQRYSEDGEKRETE